MNDSRRPNRERGDILGGRYRIDAYLGAGGMGEVYAATHLLTGQQFALKVLLPEHTKDDQACRRFAREARLSTAICDPHVITVHDVFEDTDGTPIIVMELLQGESLAARLERVQVLSLAEAVPIFLSVARALQAAHACGVVHRDLKPDNIFLLDGQPGGPVAKVLDFGIAKSVAPERLSLQTYGSSTQHGVVLGSFRYMSYEQAMGQEVTAATDVWSFAVTFVESLSGRRPLHFDTLPEMFEALIKQRVPRTRSLLPDLPPRIATLLDAYLVKDPKQRAQDVSEAVLVLEQRGIEASTPRRMRSAVLALGAAVALGASGWWLWASSRDTSSENAVRPASSDAQQKVDGSAQALAQTQTLEAPTRSDPVPAASAQLDATPSLEAPVPSAPPAVAKSAGPKPRAPKRAVLNTERPAQHTKVERPAVEAPINGRIIEQLPD